ncbi:hypothetical protein ACFL30_03860 [Candidatus Latescibacterota bacterium]
MDNLLIFIVSTVLVFACSSLNNQQPLRTHDEGPAYKSIHLLNLKSGITESQLAMFLSDSNKVISELGHPNADYHLWKTQGDNVPEYVYLWEGY